jgi:gamma-glutamyltranspeptidase/glutathione hydrolase
MTRTLVVALVALLVSQGCAERQPAPASAPAAPAVSAAGMVSSAHPLATQAGVDILGMGGNAFDAAVAVAAALNVVEPMMSGVGGLGTIVLYDRVTDRARFLNSSDRIPRRVDSDAYRSPTPGWEANRRGAKAVSTPANLRAWEAMSSEYGNLPWSDLLAPAIRLARDGFELDGETAAFIGRAFEEFPEHAKAFYGHDGRPLGMGQRLVQSDLASSLERIANEGAGVLHGGPIGEAIDAEMRARGGFLTLDDLAQAQAEWYEPIGIDYRGVRVLTAPPPANAFPALVRLGMMSRFPPGALEHNGVEYLHRFAEVTKHAFWTRLRYASDPEVAPVPLDRLLGDAYWQEQVDRIDPDTATPFVPPGVGGTEPGSGSAAPRAAEARASHTTHFVVADADGNVVSATQTLGNAFGARIMAPGTGIWLNNSLAYSTFEPAGNPMDAFAGRHKLSGDVPVLLVRDGRVWAALGTPGGHTIGQTVPQMVMNLVEFGMDIQAALSAPRISFIEPNVIIVEPGIAERVVEGLRARGHVVQVRGGIGNAHGLAIEYGADGTPVRFAGASDPRGDGLAAGPAGGR